MDRLRFLTSVLVLATAGAAARAEIIFGMTAANSGSASPGLGLVSFDSATPGTVVTVGTFSGVVAGHGIRSIDFRPTTGQLFAISTDATFAAAQLYTVNLFTAALSPVGSGFTLGTSLSSRVEMDFNPVVDRIRIVTGATEAAAQNNNFRAHPDTGALVSTDTNLTLAGNTGVSIVGGAYSNNNPGGATTTLYGWDYNSDSLVTIGGIDGVPSPNGGVMTTVNAPAGFLTFNAGLGMDISGLSGVLYVTHDDPAAGAFMSLFSRNLTTGAETLIGTYPAGTFISDLSVQPVPEPGSLALCGIGAAGLVRYVRRRKAK